MAAGTTTAAEKQAIIWIILAARPATDIRVCCCGSALRQQRGQQLHACLYVSRIPLLAANPWTIKFWGKTKSHNKLCLHAFYSKFQSPLYIILYIVQFSSCARKCQESATVFECNGQAVLVKAGHPGEAARQMCCAPSMRRLRRAGLDTGRVPLLSSLCRSRSSGNNCASVTIMKIVRWCE